ncbi:hypothetical protein [Campylobacter estrildidarum]|nr:hypothetical protein [Campylobacter estrildidarum]
MITIHTGEIELMLCDKELKYKNYGYSSALNKTRSSYLNILSF